jgi:hypothetical protein
VVIVSCAGKRYLLPLDTGRILRDGTGTCWIEFGDREVARVEVDFFRTPGHPIGTHTPASPATAAEKEAFGTERHARWFGLDVGAGPAPCRPPARW